MFGFIEDTPFGHCYWYSDQRRKPLVLADFIISNEKKSIVLLIFLPVYRRCTDFSKKSLARKTQQNNKLRFYFLSGNNEEAATKKPIHWASKCLSQFFRWVISPHPHLLVQHTNCIIWFFHLTIWIDFKKNNYFKCHFYQYLKKYFYGKELLKLSIFVHKKYLTYYF